MKDFKRLVGEQIRNIRKAKGYTQESLADKSGLSFTYISDIERGTRNISLDSLEKIIQALDIRPAELFDFPDDSANNYGDFNDKRLLIESLKSLLMERRVEEIQFIHKVAREFVNTVDQTNNEHRPYIGKK